MNTSRTRFTDLMVLVDPHIVPADDTETALLSAQLMSAARAFVTPAVLKATIPCENPNKLKRAQLLGASVEIGERYGRIHIHFNLNLTHETKIYLKHPGDGKTINNEVQEWFNERLGKSCFVSVRLADTGRAKNYATKGTKGAANSGPDISIGRKELDEAQDRPNGSSTSTS